MFCEKLDTQPVGTAQQFIAWCDDVPYIASYQEHGAGYFHLVSFKRGDDDFHSTFANERRDLFVDPEDLDEHDSPMAYLEHVLSNAR